MILVKSEQPNLSLTHRPLMLRSALLRHKSSTQAREPRITNSLNRRRYVYLAAMKEVERDVHSPTTFFEVSYLYNPSPNKLEHNHCLSSKYASAVILNDQKNPLGGGPGGGGGE